MLTTGNLNENSHYFWTDSSPNGFAFELEVVSPGDKFTVFDANHLPVAILELLENQVIFSFFQILKIKDKR